MIGYIIFVLLFNRHDYILINSTFNSSFTIYSGFFPNSNIWNLA